MKKEELVKLLKDYENKHRVDGCLKPQYQIDFDIDDKIICNGEYDITDDVLKIVNIALEGINNGN